MRGCERLLQSTGHCELDFIFLASLIARRANSDVLVFS